MKDCGNVPGWVQTTIGACLMGASLWALKTDVINNLKYFERINGELAEILALSAVIAFMLPAVAAIRGWSKSAVAFTALCVTIACWSAATVYWTSLGKDILAKADTASRYDDARTKARAARDRMDRIKETADTATLETMVLAAKSRADDLAEADTEKMSEKACFAKCQAAKREYEILLGRLADAKARDLARAELDKAEAEAKAVGPEEPSMLATKIAKHTGGNATDIALWIAIGTAMAGIAVTQGALLLAHPGVSLMASGFTLMFQKRKTAKPATRKSTRSGAKTKRPGRQAAIAREEALTILREQARQSGGLIVGSNASLAQALGVPVSTLCDPRKGWLAQWEKSGAVKIASKARGKTVVCVSGAVKVA